MKVFLSHSHKDKAIVYRVAKELKTNGIDCWIDEAEILPGDSLIEKISSGIYTTNCIVAFLSWHSVTSNWVSKELSLAMTREVNEGKIKVIPVLVDQCPIPKFLRDKLYVYLDIDDDFEKKSQSLIKSIKQIDDQKIENSTQDLPGEYVNVQKISDIYIKRRNKNIKFAIAGCIAALVFISISFPFTSDVYGSNQIIIQNLAKFTSLCTLGCCLIYAWGSWDITEAFLEDPMTLIADHKVGMFYALTHKTWKDCKKFTKYRFGVYKYFISIFLGGFLALPAGAIMLFCIFFD